MTRSDRARGLGLALLLLSLPVTSAARAGEGDVAAARALFTEARKLAAAGDYAGACPRFADSYKLDPGIGTSFNLADCEEHLGRAASAWLRFLDVAAATKAAGQAERERVARARAAALEPRLTRLVIDVPSPAPGIVVRRDGDVVPPRLWGVSVPIDPGEHPLAADAPGRRRWTANVTISAAQPSSSVEVPTLEEESPRTPPVVLVSPPKPATAEGHRIPRLSAGLGALGVASLATGTVFAVLMEMANDQAKSRCRLGAEHNLCTSHAELTQHDHELAAATRDRTIFYVAAGVGAASVIAAASWWWHAAPTEASRKSGDVAFTIAPSLSTGGARLGVEATW